MTRVATCPYCRKNAPSDEPKLRPFCSLRCKQMDLGRWLTGGYAIPADIAPEDLTAGDISELAESSEFPEDETEEDQLDDIKFRR